MKQASSDESARCDASPPETDAANSAALDGALAAVRAGLRVLPLHGIADSACTCPGGPSCPSPGKHPRHAGWQWSASSSPHAVRQWAADYPQGNFGILAADLVVLDVDPRNGGDRSYRELLQRYGNLPSTVRVNTGGGGFHLYFRQPQNGIPVLAKLPGVDVITGAKFVVAPGSLHKDGKRYELVSGSFESIATLSFGMDAVGSRVSHTEQSSLDAALTAVLLSRDGQQTGDEIRCLCPFHDDRNPSLFYNVNKRTFYCFGCQRGGTSRELASALGISGVGSDPHVGREVLAVANKLKWPGLAGTSDLNLLRAHVRIAGKAGTAQGYGASLRQVSLEASCAMETVRRAQARLKRDGWLSDGPCRCGQKNCARTHARCWNLQIPETHRKLLTTEGVRPDLGLQDQLSHDAFRFRALWKPGLRVLEALDLRTAQTVQELSDKLLWRPQRVRRSLAKLQACGVARKDEGRWIRVDRPLDDVARQFGTSGRGEEQRRRYEYDRKSHNDQLTERRRLRLVPVAGTDRPSARPTLGASMRSSATEGSRSRGARRPLRVVERG